MTSPTWVMVIDPPQLSVEEMAAVFTGGTWLTQVTVTFEGQVIEGGV
jgi:hypothetical protein